MQSPQSVSVHHTITLCETRTFLRAQNLPYYLYIYIYIYRFQNFFYVVRHLDFIASYLPIRLHLDFFRSWPSLYLPSSFSSVFLVLSFVSASTSVLFWVIFLLPFSYHVSWFRSISSIIVSSNPICCLTVTFLILSLLDILDHITLR